MTKLARPRNVEIGRLADVAKAMAELLAGGPIDSRSAIAVLSTTGASLKQIRSARERLGVVIERQGNGRSMRSFWALPGASEPPADTRSSGAPRDGVRVEEPGAPVPAAPSRVARRLEFFQARGLGQLEAHDLAVLLEARDKAGGTVVSCVECQCWVQRAWCSLRRPAIELHVCGGARLDGP